jgi:predicted flavoprotein YhiN
MEVDISTGSGKTAGAFKEDLLWTHRGLSGPAVLQISSYWRPGTPIEIDLFDGDAAAWLIGHKKSSRKHLNNLLGERLPSRLADAWCAAVGCKARNPWPICRTRHCASSANRLIAGGWCRPAPRATRRPK